MAKSDTSMVDALPFAEEKKKFILEKLDPILEEMVSDVLTEMPKKPNVFMISWLRKRIGESEGGSKLSLKEKLHKLKKELDQLTSSLHEVAAAGHQQKTGEGEDDEEEEEESDDDCDELPEDFIKPEGQMGMCRQSVSAEAYGQWNQKKEFTPPKHPKTPEQMERLGGTLGKSFMFSALGKDDMDLVLLAMKECQFTAQTHVIKEGDDGDFLFVIEKGSLDCIKTIKGEEKIVKTVEAGDVFGELALLYNCPRAANVVARDECVCWRLDRETFNHIVKDAAVKRRDRYDKFLQSVPLLASIDVYERSQISDALKPESFKKGDRIVQQDEPGDKFYIIEQGELYATKGELKVMDYKPGDYFGELALLKNQPRAASVIVASDECNVLSLSRVSFNKMLGPLHAMLGRNIANYDG